MMETEYSLAWEGQPAGHESGYVPDLTPVPGVSLLCD